jgi:hypothetical protein
MTGIKTYLSILTMIMDVKALYDKHTFYVLKLKRIKKEDPIIYCLQ